MNEATPLKRYTIQYKGPSFGWDIDDEDRDLSLTEARQTLSVYRREYRELQFRLLDTSGNVIDEQTLLPAAVSAPVVKLPTDDKERKERPVFRGPLMYFPNALLEVARVCKVGNDQHSPGQPMHWARGKSTEQMDTALRHMMDHGLGNTKDIDGTYHLAKAAWRILAELQLTIEKESE